MKAVDVLRISGGALTKQRRRTLLSLVGVAIGVAAVVVLTALGEGARRFVNSQFETIGTNVLAVLPGKVETTGGIPGFGGVPHDLTLADARALRSGIAAARHVAPVVVANDTVERGARSRQSIVLGSTAELLHVRDLEVSRGRFLPQGPWDRGAPVAVIGPKLVTELFPGESPLGKIVRVGSWRMRVIGVLATQGVHFGMDMDETIVVPVATAMRMFNRSSLFRIVLEIGSGQDLDAAQERCKRLLVERHGEEDFTLMTPEAILSALGGILDALTLALAGIAAISLSVAGIGIMNVMLVSVSERTAEIGLCKALGATRAQILAVFVTEAGLLSAAGGVVGLVCGFAAVELLVALFPAVPAGPPAWAPVSAFGLAVLVGVLFGLLPARRAVRLDPVAALAGR